MVNRTSAAAPRKRARASNDEEPRASTAKRRRNQAPEESSDTVVANTGTDEEPKPLSRGRSVRGARAGKPSPPPPDAWDVPDAEEKPRKRRAQPAQSKAARPAATTQKESIYDVPDSGEDEISAAPVAPRSGRQKPAAQPAAVEEKAPEVVKKKRGRPSKKDLEARALAAAQNGTTAAAKIPPAARTARSGREPVRHGTPAGSDVFAADADMQDLPAQESLRRGAKAAKRLGEGAVEPPKGILTPRKGKVGADQLRKSVAFNPRSDDDALDELAVGTPSKSSRKPREMPEAVGESGSDEEDDEVCAICGKPDSKKPNEIVFCDNCDMAVHQKCYGLAEIPEGDWICRSCSQDDATLTGINGNEAARAPVVARDDRQPDIPNFDLHLRSAQRVLLDRCLGKRRIKLRGQDEAYEKAYQLVQQTVVAGEGNSMMVIGARGCGKTTVRCPPPWHMCMAELIVS